MSEPYIGQITMAAFFFAPKNFALCNGQLMSIAQNQMLFSLIGTMYGGDGVTTFGLPNLGGRTPVQRGNLIQQGERGGEEDHTLTTAEVPPHGHQFMGSTAPATAISPVNAVLAAKAATRGTSVYAPSPASQALAPSAVSNVGSSQPHSNMQPYLTILFFIALTGSFPSGT